MPVKQPEIRPVQVTFRVDASTQMGGGHVMRCLTLARCLLSAGARVAFVTAAITDPLRQLVSQSGIRLIDIAPPVGAAHGEQDWDRASWPVAVQLEDAERTAAQLDLLGCDTLVVDHYGLDDCWENAVRAHTGAIAVIDDLANRRHSCALLLDQTYGRSEMDYRPWTGPDAELLLGAGYALLRPEFATARGDALERHFAAGPVGRILISLGMTDVGALTEIAARAALDATSAEIDIVLGSAAPTLGRLRAFSDAEPRVTLHVDTDRVCALMTAADLAIGAAGTTSWERCCLGLPAITFAVAGNQRTIAAKLAEAGAIHFLEAHDAAAIAESIAHIAADRAYRVALAQNSAAICDGTGADAVAGRLLAPRTALPSGTA